MDRQPTEMGAMEFLSHPPADLETWVQVLVDREIPVLADSAGVIEDLRRVEDDVDAHRIAEGIAEDPLMILKLLRHVAHLPRRGDRERTDAETAIEALVMLGITPFFRAFGPQVTVEEILGNQAQAMLELGQVIRRARRAARFALAFAIHRQDHDAAVIHQATLMHEFAEMLLWCHAPGLAMKVAEIQRADPALPSAQAQFRVLNVHLADVQQALMKEWRLPELLVRISDGHDSEQAQVRNVQLAIRVAQHSAQGWDNPALQDDVDELAALLNIGTTPTWTLLQDIET